MHAHPPAAVIVVGAGILGAAAAYHLRRTTRGPVLLVEATVPGRATSGSGAGFVGYWTAGYMPVASRDEWALEDDGIGFYRELAARGASIDLRENGSLFVATSDAGSARVLRIAEHELAPPGTRVLDPGGTSDVSGGLLAADAVTVSVLHPGGIQLSAGRAARALASKAEADGVEVRTDTLVTGLLTDDAGITGVRTVRGDIPAATVVLACGPWSNELLQPLGCTLPLARYVASRVVSPPSRVPGSAPTVMVPEWGGLWLREHRGGLTWGNTAGYAPLADVAAMPEVGRTPEVPALVDAMVDDLAPRLATLVPGHDRSAAGWAQGVPCGTPDGRFLAGPMRGVPGLFVLAGDNEAGVTHGPGLGRLLAAVVSGGSVDVDASAYDPARFEGSDLTDLTEQEILAAAPAYE